jgi:integrase/recombinase XerD
MKLLNAIEKHIDMKQSLGISNKWGAGMLRAFSRQVGDVPIGSVTKANVLRFLDLGRTSDVTWMVKYRMLKAFFEYWIARGEVRELPMPRPRAAAGGPPVAPYIYSVSDIRRLLWGTCFMHRLTSRAVDPPTVRAVLMFLYGTGARIDETLALAQGDVDLRNHTVTFHRSTRSARTIPIGPTLAQWLRVYSVSDSYDAEHFFARKNGKAIEPRLLLRTFESVCHRMGVSRVDGMGRQPRLRDLRRTFAVHCLKAWTDQKKDLRKMLPILAAYLGHVNLSSTEEYLLLAPNRFRKQLSTLSPAFVQEC